jgi:hypothetical protein
MIPALSSTLLPKVDTPEVTTNPPEVILIPVLAVTNPIASTLVTSS